MIVRKELEQQVNMKALDEEIQAVVSAAVTTPQRLLSFVHHYISWNGYFGSGVATLAGKIGRSRSVFLDPNEELSAVADRSVLVASYVFDAAREEFNDKSTPWRDTHRCLAQAFLKGSHTFLSEHHTIDDDIYNVPFWLKGLNARVAQGYGAHSSDEAMQIFRAMGYHLGSELLADKEFSLIDSFLQDRFPELISFLHTNTFTIGTKEHNGYTWLHTHSGHGNAVEADHFDYAMRGVKLAYEYLPPEQEKEMDYHLLEGFHLFARDHQEFFTRMMEDLQQ